MDEIGSKIRIQRLEADERKKEKEVKLTDRVPPAKRPRTGGCELYPAFSFRWLGMIHLLLLFFWLSNRECGFTAQNFISKNSQ